jgi:alkylation response protein AidB-like acyl-CoA dehydrogenase
MTCTATEQADGSWILNGHKAWITNAGANDFYTVLAVTDPDGTPRRQHLGLRRREERPGLHLR